MDALARRCTAQTNDGEPCNATPLRDADFCVYHSPAHRESMQQARRLGGLRRRKEATVGAAYEIDGIDSAVRIRRVVEIAVLDTLELPNSLARNRTLAVLAQVALRVSEQAEQEDRLRILEASVLPRSAVS